MSNCPGVSLFSLNRDGQERWKLHSTCGALTDALYIPTLSGVFTRQESSIKNYYFPFWDDEKIVYTSEKAYSYPEFGINVNNLTNLNYRINSPNVIKVTSNTLLTAGSNYFGSTSTLYSGQDGRSHTGSYMYENEAFVVQKAGNDDLSCIGYTDDSSVFVINGDASYLYTPTLNFNFLANVSGSILRIFYNDYNSANIVSGTLISTSPSFNLGPTDLIGRESVLYKRNTKGSVFQFDYSNYNMPSIFIDNSEYGVGDTIPDFPWYGDSSLVTSITYNGNLRDREITLGLLTESLQYYWAGSNYLERPSYDSGVYGIPRANTKHTISLYKDYNYSIHGSTRTLRTVWNAEFGRLQPEQINVLTPAQLDEWTYAWDTTTGTNVYNHLIHNDQVNGPYFLSVDKFTGAYQNITTLVALLTAAGVESYIGSQYTGTQISVAEYADLTGTSYSSGTTLVYVNPAWTAKLNPSTGRVIPTTRDTNLLPTVYHYNREGTLNTAIVSAPYFVSVVNYGLNQYSETDYTYFLLGEVVWSDGGSPVFTEYTTLNGNPSTTTAAANIQGLNLCHHMFGNANYATETRFRSLGNTRYAIEPKSTIFRKIKSDSVLNGNYGSTRAILIAGLGSIYFQDNSFTPSPPLGAGYSESYVFPANVRTAYNSLINYVNNNVFMFDNGGNLLLSTYISNPDTFDLDNLGNIYIGGNATSNRIQVFKTKNNILTQYTYDEIYNILSNNLSIPIVSNHFTELLSIPSYRMTDGLWLVPDFDGLNNTNGSINLMLGNYRFNIGLSEDVSSIESRLNSLGLSVKVYGSSLSDCKPIVIANLFPSGFAGISEISVGDGVLSLTDRIEGSYNGSSTVNPEISQTVFQAAISGVLPTNPNGVSTYKIASIILDSNYSIVEPQTCINLDGTLDFIENIGYDKISNWELAYASGNWFSNYYLEPNISNQNMGANSFGQFSSEFWRFVVKNSESSIDAKIRNIYKLNAYGIQWSKLHGYSGYYRDGYVRSYPDNIAINSIDAKSNYLYISSDKYIHKEDFPDKFNYHENYNRIIRSLNHCGLGHSYKAHSSGITGSLPTIFNLADASGYYFGQPYSPSGFIAYRHYWKNITPDITPAASETNSGMIQYGFMRNAIPDAYFHVP